MKHQAIIVVAAMLATSAPAALAQAAPDQGRQQDQQETRGQQNEDERNQRSSGQFDQRSQRQDDRQSQFGQQRRQQGQTRDGVTKVHKVNDVMGKEVQNAQGETIGKIKDLAVDTQRGRVVYAVLEPKEKLAQGKYLAVPIPVLELDSQKDVLILAVTKAQLQGAQGFDDENWPSQPSAIWGARSNFDQQRGQQGQFDQQRRQQGQGNEFNQQRDQQGQSGQQPRQQDRRSELNQQRDQQGQSDQQPRQQDRRSELDQQRGQQGQAGQQPRQQDRPSELDQQRGQQDQRSALGTQGENARPEDRLMKQRLEAVLVKKEGDRQSEGSAIRSQGQTGQKAFLTKEQMEKIQVRSEAGTVKLTGEVESEEMKKKITKAVEEMPGIEKVDNKLEVKNQTKNQLR